MTQILSAASVPQRKGNIQALLPILSLLGVAFATFAASLSVNSAQRGPRFSDSTSKLIRGTYILAVAARYSRLIFDLAQHYAIAKLRPHQPPAGLKERYSTAHDVTIISCSLDGGSHYARSVNSWLESNPKEIIVVTARDRIDAMRDKLSLIKDGRITITSVPRPGFRGQLLEGISRTTTELVVFADDRVIWGRETLKYLVYGFHNDTVGAVSVPQLVQSSAAIDNDLTIWESFGALNLVRRNILHCSLAYFNNGQVMNLSGRTVAYRTKILKDVHFQKSFTNDLWRGKYLLKTGDDSFITGWLYANDWATCMQKHDSAFIVAGVNADWTYLKQLLRWSRDAARQYSRELGYAIRSSKYRHIKRSLLNLASNYATDLAVLFELAFLASFGVAGRTASSLTCLRDLFFEHLTVASFLTVLEHLQFFNSWRRVLYAPFVVVYMYMHAFTVLYAIFTLEKTEWGSRKV